MVQLTTTPAQFKSNQEFIDIIVVSSLATVLGASNLFDWTPESTPTRFQNDGKFLAVATGG